MKNQSKTVEYNLEASAFDWEIAPGKIIKAWGFNKQLPGPTLRANTGDTLAVRITNNLKESTTIRWHGITPSSSKDGLTEVQKTIEPGECFVYCFVVPNAGTFWYYAHKNETRHKERGMYGALVVYGETDPAVDDEKIFMMDDMKLNKNNEFTVPTWFLQRMVERYDARLGNTLLINGKENLVIHVNGSQTERWRFINSSGVRHFYLHIGSKMVKIIASGGRLLEHPITATEVLLRPGKRLDIAVGPFTEGDSFKIESLTYNRTTFTMTQRETIATVIVGLNKTAKIFIPERVRTKLLQKTMLGTREN